MHSNLYTGPTSEATLNLLAPILLSSSLHSWTLHSIIIVCCQNPRQHHPSTNFKPTQKHTLFTCPLYSCSCSPDALVDNPNAWLEIILSIRVVEVSWKRELKERKKFKPQTCKTISLDKTRRKNKQTCQEGVWWNQDSLQEHNFHHMTRPHCSQIAQSCQ